MEDVFKLRSNEQQDDYLYRLGSLKEAGTIQATWPELSAMMNEVLRKHLPPWDVSSWRKRYYKLRADPPKPQPLLERNEEGELEVEQELEPVSGEDAQSIIAEAKRERVMINDIRVDQNRIMRQAARAISMQELLRDAVTRFEPPQVEIKAPDPDNPKALYAMLSDIHYGLAFNNRAGSYSPAIAWQRVLMYAKRLVEIGKQNNIDTIYVSLMGDMISGIIHSSIRLENRENIVGQITGASELVSEFLRILSTNFAQVYVNSVSGNHSRIEPSLMDSPKGERLDRIVWWFCNYRFENIPNVVFVDNELDETIGSFDIMGKTYICVHGDLDPDIRTSANRIPALLHKNMDYFLYGHMHVPDFRFEHTGFICNGSVCGSGDEYTSKKRLYSPPSQVCMIVSPNGVDAVYPVIMQEDV